MHDRKSQLPGEIAGEIPTLKALLVRAQKEMKSTAEKAKTVLQNFSIIDTFLVETGY